jgi:hypothetical protein
MSKKKESVENLTNPSFSEYKAYSYYSQCQ